MDARQLWLQPKKKKSNITHVTAQSAADINFEEQQLKSLHYLVLIKIHDCRFGCTCFKSNEEEGCFHRHMTVTNKLHVALTF